VCVCVCVKRCTEKPKNRENEHIHLTGGVFVCDTWE
jgi:hypothetical protein